MRGTTQDPIDVVIADGKKLIADGHHRAAAAIKAGLSEVPINVVEKARQRRSDFSRRSARQHKMQLHERNIDEVVALIDRFLDARASAYSDRWSIR